MSARKLIILGLLACGLFPFYAECATGSCTRLGATHEPTISNLLGWVIDPMYECGGYYLEQAFVSPVKVDKDTTVTVTGDNSLFSQCGTSSIEGNVKLNRFGEQMTADKAFVYRDPATCKFTTLDLIGDVNLRQPNTLVVGKLGHYDFQTKRKSLSDITYRTKLNTDKTHTPRVTREEMQSDRKITSLTAWGYAEEVSQSEPRVYELQGTSFSTCPPTNTAWHVKASHIVLDKNTGRGYATNARIYVRQVPVFYFPYINFSIDGQRKTGFLWPTFGIGSNKWGPYLLAPIYLNLAPNYDMKVTPGYLSKRGTQLSDQFRYLTESSTGVVNVSFLPSDKFFAIQQSKYKLAPPIIPNQPVSVTEAETNRLLNSSTTRRAFSWRNDSIFSDSWSSHVDFNYAGDDYYMEDFGSNLNEITQNQLLQEGDVYYKSEHWHFTGRLQAYQTLHPLDEQQVLNQYRRLPQLLLSSDYPDQPYGLEYFTTSEITHFDLLNNPGAPIDQPIGNRLNFQPGVSLPLNWPYFYINPRFQMALSDYQLYQIADTNAPGGKKRGVPIFDVASGLMFNRDFTLFHYAFEQTLEPQIYYDYIPYRNQASIPVFDTTVNTLTYDQLFNYNRFSGIDRIGDANQIGVGVSSRFIDQETGLEKVRVGVGQIIYFANRNVTLCNGTECSDNPTNHSNYQRLSPVSGLIDYHVSDQWHASANGIWNPVTRQLDNSTVGLSYAPSDQKVVNIGYSFARNGNVQSGIQTNNATNNLKLTDFSFAWPVIHDVSAVGRWSQDWNANHFQNLLYGLQYDTCCWAVQMVGGRALTAITPTSTAQYNSEFYIQFALKGLGNIENGNATGLLSSISGYKPQFGQGF